MKKNTLLSITLMFCIPVFAIQAQIHEGISRSKKVSLRKAPKYHAVPGSICIFTAIDESKGKF